MSNTARISLMALMIGIVPMASARTQPPAASAPVVSPGDPVRSTPVISPGDPGTLPAPNAVGDALAAEAQRQLAARELAAFDAEAAALRPGQFAWRPERSASGPIEVVVSLAQQKAYVYRGGALIAATTVSTGRAGHRTPTGTFPIMEKARTHFSSRYNNAPMPNMQRLTSYGIALHAGRLPGYAASHGCVRMPMEFSRLLYGITRIGERVHIIGGAPPAASAGLAFATGRGPMRTAAR